MTSLFKIYKSGSVHHTQEVYQIGQPAAEKPQQPQQTGGGSPPVSQIFEQAKATAYEEAQSMVNGILEKTELERQRVLQAAQKQAEEMMQTAYSEGYRSGYQQGVAEGVAQKTSEIQRCVDELGNSVAEIEGSLSGFFAQYQADLRWMALEIAEKILNARIEQDDLQLKELVRGAIDTVKTAEWVKVELSQQSADLIRQLQEELQAHPHISVVGTSAPPGSCTVETPSGKIDASVAAQLENLREYFASRAYME